MLITRRTFFEASLSLVTVAGLHGADIPSLAPEQAMAELVAGNRRFTTGKSNHPNSSLDRAKFVGKEGQHPHSVVLTCSDSRVAPEILFDQGIGDLFVIRVAGNVANGDEIGSIEYAVEHLHVSLCVVLGHASCGAVAAVVDGENVSKEIANLVQPIQRSYMDVKAHHPKADRAELIRETVRMNVLGTSKTLSDRLATAVKSGQLQIKGAVYDIETTKVDWLG